MRSLQQKREERARERERERERERGPEFFGMTDNYLGLASWLIRT